MKWQCIRILYRRLKFELIFPVQEYLFVSILLKSDLQVLLSRAAVSAHSHPHTVSCLQTTLRATHTAQACALAVPGCICRAAASSLHSSLPACSSPCLSFS